jgi:hypothetical protein
VENSNRYQPIKGVYFCWELDYPPANWLFEPTTVFYIGDIPKSDTRHIKTFKTKAIDGRFVRVLTLLPSDPKP